MESPQHHEEEAADHASPQDHLSLPLLQSVDPPSSDLRPRNHLKDLHILSFSFLFVFLAYSATQNLESSLNSDQNLGSVSLGVLYLSLTVCSVGAAYPVRWLGSKRGILLGLSGYWIYIMANIFPSWYTMIPAALFLGFTASLLWVAEGTYITCAAKSHAAQVKLSEESVIGKFNGEFWGLFACNQVVGNLLSLIILQSGKGASANSSETSSSTWLLLIFLGCMLVGTGLCFFLDSQADLSKQSLAAGTDSTLDGFVNTALSLMIDKRLLLLLPLLVYSGLQQAFIWGDFTGNIVTPALGISLVGGVMAAFGAADAGCSLIAGRLSTGLSSISIIIFSGAAAQLLVLLRLMFQQSYGSDLSGYLNLFGLAIIWGLGDAAFNTQISALLGILFPDNTEAAFAQWKIWQSVATAVVFFITNYTLMSVRLIILLATLTVSVVSFSTLRFIFFKKSIS